MESKPEEDTSKESQNNTESKVDDSDLKTNVTLAETPEKEPPKNIEDECDANDNECDIPDEENEAFDPNIKSMMDRKTFNTNNAPNMTDDSEVEKRKISDSNFENEFTIINQSSFEEAKNSTGSNQLQKSHLNIEDENGELIARCFN